MCTCSIPHNRILGYQFDVSCGIQQAVSLVDPLEYMIQPRMRWAVAPSLG